MPNVKYQIFVSSTYADLRKEREQVIKAVLEMGHIPVGMEMFSAADEEQWKIIARQIDQSDYYVVIVAHRYGSIVNGKSYTEKEYDYALEKEVPILGFIIDDSVPWNPGDIDKDASVKHSLDSFKAKVRNKPVGFWKSAEDLHSKVSIALMKAINTQPRPGWVRTSDVIASPEISAEITRLSRENAELRKNLNNEVGHQSTAAILSAISIDVSNQDWIPSDIRGKRMSMLDLLIRFQGELAIGVSNDDGGYKEHILYEKVAPKLLIHGLVNKELPGYMRSIKGFIIKFTLNSNGLAFLRLHDRQKALANAG